MTMKIGLISVDNTKFPNIALGKLARWYKERGAEVEWYNALNRYDKVYLSKIFTFSPDAGYYVNADETEKGGTGYDIHSTLPAEIDMMQPDYSIFPQVDGKTAYGFITRGCPNKCPWCVVPRKEGGVKPYMDVEEVAIEGRTRLILMDNNILACDYGLAQIEKIIRKRYRVDFNQALDARLVNGHVANMLAHVKWLAPIRFGCDTMGQISSCENAMRLIDKCSGRRRQYLLYCMIHGDISENEMRLSYFRANSHVRIVAQPFRDLHNSGQMIPQWQKDMARWAMRREIYATCKFRDFEPRKGFKCKEYFKDDGKQD